MSEKTIICRHVQTSSIIAIASVRYRNISILCLYFNIFPYFITFFFILYDSWRHKLSHICHAQSFLIFQHYTVKSILLDRCRNFVAYQTKNTFFIGKTIIYLIMKQVQCLWKYTHKSTINHLYFTEWICNILVLSIQFIRTLVTIDRLIFWTMISNFVLALVRCVNKIYWIKCMCTSLENKRFNFQFGMIW